MMRSRAAVNVTMFCRNAQALQPPAVVASSAVRAQQPAVLGRDMQ